MFPAHCRGRWGRANSPRLVYNRLDDEIVDQTRSEFVICRIHLVFKLEEKVS